MIIVAIVALSAVVLAAIMVVFGSGLPSISSSVMAYANAAIGYIRSGAGLFWSFVNPGPVKAMLALTLSGIAIYEGYKIVMWVVKKIPMFGVSDD